MILVDKNNNVKDPDVAQFVLLECIDNAVVVDVRLLEGSTAAVDDNLPVLDNHHLHHPPDD